MSIKAENITKRYGQQKALDNISFEIASGQVVGFLGPNGAGKSTMMKIITGFIPPTEGRVWVNQLSIEKESIAVRRQIGYLPEHNPLYLEMYVKEYLAFVAGLYRLKQRKQRVADMIAQTGLSREQNKKIGALSKGYRQRVGIAQAMIHDPKVLILDEPTSGLDPNQIVDIRNLISCVGKEKTVMLSTHIMQEVEAICDRIIILKQGRIVANDSTQNIQSQTEQNYQTIIVEFNQKPDIEALKAVDGVKEVIEWKLNNWLVQSTLNEDIRPRLFEFAVDNKLQVLSMQQKEKRLEEVFQELTQ